MYPGHNNALAFNGEDSTSKIPTLSYEEWPITLELTVRPMPYKEGKRHQHTGWQTTVHVEHRDGGLWLRSHYTRSTAHCKEDGSRIEANHVAAVWARQTNSQLLSTGSSRWSGEDVFVHNDQAATDCFFGASPNISGDGLFQFFRGTIDEVRISNVARYTKDYTPQERLEADEHTLALYHFDEGTGDKLIDSSGHNHHGKIHGAKWVRVGGSSSSTPAPDPDHIVEVRRFEGHEGPILGPNFVHPDGTLLVSQQGGKGLFKAFDGKENYITTWDIATGIERHSVKLPRRPGLLAMSPDGRYFTATESTPGTSAGQFTLFRIDEVKPKWKLPFDTGVPYGATFSPASDRILTFGLKDWKLDHGLRVWDTESGRQLWNRDFYRGEWLPDGSAVIASKDEGTELYLLGAADGAEIGRLKQSRSDVLSAEKTLVDRLGRRVVAATASGTLVLWDLQTKRELHRHNVGKGWICPCAIVHDDRDVLIYNQNRICLLDIETGKELSRMEGHTDRILSLKVIPGERFAISGGCDNTMRLWELATGKQLARVDADGNYAANITVLPDGKHVVSSECWSFQGEAVFTTSDHTLRLWRLPESVWPENAGRLDPPAADPDQIVEVRRFKGHSGGVSPIFLNPDGRSMSSSGQDHNCIIWDIATGEQLQKLRIGGNGDHSMSSDGRFVASTNGEGEVSLWEVASGKRIWTAENPSGGANSEFSPDGKRLLVRRWPSVAIDNRSVCVFDTTTGRELWKRTIAGWVVDWSIRHRSFGGLSRPSRS